MDKVLLLENVFEIKKLSRVPATGPFFLVFRSASFLLISWSIATAQEFPKSAFGILNLVPRPMIIKISLGSNLLTPGDEEINQGFYSGMMPWRPEKEILKAEAAGYQSAELKPFLKPTETPVIILQENPAKTLKLTVLPCPTQKKEVLPFLMPSTSPPRNPCRLRQMESHALSRTIKVSV